MAGKTLRPRKVTKFNVPCAFGGQASEVAIFIGEPDPKHNPIQFQAKFIQDVRGGVIPQSVFESLEKLQKLSIENGVPFEELCRYALSSINEQEKIESNVEGNNENANNTDATTSDTNTQPQNTSN